MGVSTRHQVLRLLLWGGSALFALLALVVSINDVEAKAWRIRISGGDLPQPVVMAESSFEVQGQYRNSNKTAVRFGHNEVCYLLETFNGENGGTVSRVRYFPRTTDHPAILISGDEQCQPELQDSYYSPNTQYETALNQHILLARVGLIGDAPGRFEVIGKSAKLQGGAARFQDEPEGIDIDLTKLHGFGFWDLMMEVQLRPDITRSMLSSETYSLWVYTGDNPAIPLIYYPSHEDGPGFITSRHSFNHIYGVPDSLDERFKNALGIETSGTSGVSGYWVWLLLGGGSFLAFTVVGAIILRRAA